MRGKFHDLDWEERAPYLFGLAEAKGFPIITFEESTEVVSTLEEGDYVADYSGDYEIDTAKLVEPKEGEPWRDLGSLSYVGHLIEKALIGWTDETTSRKYSFGDTPDWWTEFAPDGEPDRPKIKFHVGVSF